MTLKSPTMPDLASTAAVEPPREFALALAQRFLGLALCNDYLSSGRGHQQSRRVVGERAMQRRTAPAFRSKPATVGERTDPELRYLAEVAAQLRLTSCEEYGLARRMKTGDRRAHDALIEANLGLVVMFARRFQRPGVPMLDLIAEGNIGLIAAARRFDPERGYRFATYAKWWVLQAIQQALPRLVGVVRIPASHARRPAAQAPDDETHPMAGGDEPDTTSAIAADAESFPDAQAADENEAGRRFGRTGVELSDAEMLERIAIPAEREPPGETMAAQRIAVLQRALDALPERDRVVLTERYALRSDTAVTLEALSARFGVSIERIRQIENAAVKKLGAALAEAGESADTLL